MAIRKLLKILHTIGTCGMVGAVGGALLLIGLAPQETPESYAAMRQTIAILSGYVLLPSLGITLVSGLLAMAAHGPYMDKGWALLKAGFGVIVFKAGLHIVSGHEHYAKVVTDRVAEGLPLTAELRTNVLAHESLMLWTLLALSVANIVVGVWRPKFSRRKTADAAPKSQDDGAPLPGYLRGPASPAE